VNETPSSRGDDPPPNPRRQRIAAVGQKARDAPRPNLIERRTSKFLREPPSIRMAASVIVTATAVVAIITAALTSAFVARAEREHALADGVEDAALEARLNARFDRLESMLHEEKT
jgi:hypothetical protein